MNDYANPELDRQLYLYPNSDVLRNKLNIRDQAELTRRETALVYVRLRDSTAPSGDFRPTHIQQIHRHLFQQVYSWAGEYRQTVIHKKNEIFFAQDMYAAPRHIEAGLWFVHDELKSQNYLRGLSEQQFVNKAARVLGDLYYVHPFREGNTRTQLVVAQQIAKKAGYRFTFQNIGPSAWQKANFHSLKDNLKPLEGCIEAGIMRNAAAKTVSQANKAPPPSPAKDTGSEIKKPTPAAKTTPGKPSAAQAAKREASRSRSRTRSPNKPKRGGPSR